MCARVGGIIWSVATVSAAIAAVVVFLVIAVRIFYVGPRRRRTPRVAKDTKRGATIAARSVGFVHPAAACGGGGERVLWVAIQALAERDAARGVHRRIVVYCDAPEGSPQAGSDAKEATEKLLATVKQQFGLHRLSSDTVEVAWLRRRATAWMDPARYPRLTLILQSLVGGFIVGCEVLRAGPTDVLVDSVGIAFPFPLYRFVAGATVLAYVHYPTVSVDMISRVANRSAGFNNDSAIAGSAWLTHAKVLYYRAFALVYWLAGQCCDSAVANSSWTQHHIAALWRSGTKSAPIVVFPPVGAAELARLPLAPAKRTNSIVSVGQFRPEKNHALQIEAFAKACATGLVPAETLLYLVGGVRNAVDRARVDALRALASEKGVADRVRFEVSAPYSRVAELLGSCAVGLHAMTDEHFGIVVVEYMAGGCVPLAHNSGGVRADIVDPPKNGLLAGTLDEFAAGMGRLLSAKLRETGERDGTRGDSSSPPTFSEMQIAARAKAGRFSDAFFGETLWGHWDKFLA